ncbi:unnamed protein product, partial [Amoebophrya sp. A120]
AVFVCRFVLTSHNSRRLRTFSTTLQKKIHYRPLYCQTITTRTHSYINHYICAPTTGLYL